MGSCSFSLGKTIESVFRYWLGSNAGTEPNYKTSLIRIKHEGHGLSGRKGPFFSAVIDGKLNTQVIDVDQNIVDGMDHVGPFFGLRSKFESKTRSFSHFSKTCALARTIAEILSTATRIVPAVRPSRDVRTCEAEITNTMMSETLIPK